MLRNGVKDKERTFVKGQYRLVAESGHAPLSGPLTEVFHGREVQSGREVAFKRFLPQFSRDPRFAIRFREQLRVLAAVQHPVLVTILDYGLDDDAFYIASEWVVGINLGTYLAEYGAFSPAAAVYVARQICAGLGALHEKEIVHRGLKPENIFITSEGRVKLADAALSQLASESGLSKTTVMLGAVDYMSPEQARGRPTGPQSDIYSLGVILFELLTDRLPFTADDSWSVVRMHAQAPPPSPRQHNRDVSPELAAVVQKALHKSREGRYRNVTALDEALAPLPQSDDLLWLIAPHHVKNGAERRRFLPFDLRSVASRVEARLQTVNDAVRGRLEPLLERRRQLPFGQQLLLQFVLTFVVGYVIFYALSGLMVGNNVADAVGAAGMENARRAAIHKTLPLPEATPTLAPTAVVVEQPPEPAATAAATEPPAAPVEAAQQSGSGSPGGGPANNGGGGNGPPPHAGPPGGPPGQSGGNPGRGNGRGGGKP